MYMGQLGARGGVLQEQQQQRRVLRLEVLL
jgi:hypothetical protein